MFKLLSTSRTQVREAWGWTFGTLQSFSRWKSLYIDRWRNCHCCLKIVKAPGGCDQKIDYGRSMVKQRNWRDRVILGWAQIGKNQHEHVNYADKMPNDCFNLCFFGLLMVGSNRKVICTSFTRKNTTKGTKLSFFFADLIRVHRQMLHDDLPPCHDPETRSNW